VRRSILALAAGLFLTAAVTAGLVRNANADPVATTTSSTTTTAPLATWADETEIVLPPVIIVPTDASYEGGAVSVEYEILGMTHEPLPRFPVVEAVWPSTWTLLTDGGEFSTAIDPGAARVVFDVGFDFDPASITGLRLDEYILRSPIQAWFLPSPDDFTVYEIAPGVTAALDIVQEQSNGAIVRVQLAADRLGAAADLAAEGVGPGWVVASSNFGGGGLWTLSFDGERLPDPLTIRVRGVIWIPIETSLHTDLEAVTR
jgi:hypothetical protein